MAMYLRPTENHATNLQQLLLAIAVAIMQKGISKHKDLTDLMTREALQQLVCL